jgi:hypothetical protein
MLGLHRMNAQHVRRQMKYAEIVLENRNSHPHKPLDAQVPAPSNKKP